MSLDDLVEQKSSNDSGGLSEFFGVKANKEKLRNPELCPGCGSDNTEKVHYYWRCKEDSDKCEVITYIPSEHGIDRELWAKR